MKYLFIFYRMFFFFSITLYSRCSVHYLNIHTKVLLQVKRSEQRVSEGKYTTGNIDKLDEVALLGVFAFLISQYIGCSIQGVAEIGKCILRCVDSPKVAVGRGAEPFKTLILFALPTYTSSVYAPGGCLSV